MSVNRNLRGRVPVLLYRVELPRIETLFSRRL